MGRYFIYPDRSGPAFKTVVLLVWECKKDELEYRVSWTIPVALYQKCPKSFCTTELVIFIILMARVDSYLMYVPLHGTISVMSHLT
uniref:Uncharacterized protein n=1 Tax=Romanomermis culicivorax TaxID=13658 RepID=A0A915KA33_ROMCU